MSLVQASLWLLLAVLSLADSLKVGSKMGPYDIVLEYVTNCAPDASPLFSYEIHPYFVKKDGVRKQLFKVNATFAFSKEDFYAMKIPSKFYQKKNNNFLLMNTYNGNLCATVDTYGKKTWNGYLERVGLEKDECAIKPGTYTIPDWDPMIYHPAPMLEYGQYKVVGQVVLNNTVIACFESLGEVKPKS